MRCPTVRVKSEHSPDGYIVINESDLTDAHEVVKEENQIPEFLPNRNLSEPQIPANWEDMHWKKQVKLAKALGRQDFGRELSGEQAKEFIRLKVAERDGQ